MQAPPPTQAPSTTQAPQQAPPPAQGQAGQVVITQAPPTGPRVYLAYRHRQARFLGWAQIAIGLLSILFYSLAIYFDSLNNSYDYIPIFTATRTGIWCGVIFLLPGSFGVISAYKKNLCPIVTFMVLSILAIVFCGLAYFGWSAAAVVITASSQDYNCGYVNHTYYRETSETCQTNHGLIAMFAICLILSIAYLVIAIWSSVICCLTVCCGSSTQTNIMTSGGQQVVYMQGGTGQNPQQQYPQQQYQQQQYPQQQYSQQQYQQPQYPQQQYPQQQYPQQQYPQQQYPQHAKPDPSAPAYSESDPPPSYDDKPNV